MKQLQQLGSQTTGSSRAEWWQEHTAAAGLWNKTMAAVMAPGTACEAKRQHGVAEAKWWQHRAAGKKGP